MNGRDRIYEILYCFSRVGLQDGIRRIRTEQGMRMKIIDPENTWRKEEDEVDYQHEEAENACSPMCIQAEKEKEEERGEKHGEQNRCHRDLDWEDHDILDASGAFGQEEDDRGINAGAHQPANEKGARGKKAVPVNQEEACDES